MDGEKVEVRIKVSWLVCGRFRIKGRCMCIVYPLCFLEYVAHVLRRRRGYGNVLKYFGDLVIKCGRLLCVSVLTIDEDYCNGCEVLKYREGSDIEKNFL